MSLLRPPQDEGLTASRRLLTLSLDDLPGWLSFLLFSQEMGPCKYAASPSNAASVL